MSFPTNIELVRAAINNIVEVTTYGQETDNFIRLKDKLQVVDRTVKINRCLTLKGSVEYITFDVSV